MRSHPHIESTLIKSHFAGLWQQLLKTMSLRCTRGMMTRNGTQLLRADPGGPRPRAAARHPDADQGAVLPCQIRSRWYGAAEVSVINRAWIGPPGPPPLAEKLGRRVSEAAGGTWDSPCRLGLGALARGRWALILRGGAGLGAEVSAPVVAPAHPGSCCLRTQCH